MTPLAIVVEPAAELLHHVRESYKFRKRRSVA
jgi:hypothetical protein